MGDVSTRVENGKVSMAATRTTAGWRCVHFPSKKGAQADTTVKTPGDGKSEKLEKKGGELAQDTNSRMLSVLGAAREGEETTQDGFGRLGPDPPRVHTNKGAPGPRKEMWEDIGAARIVTCAPIFAGANASVFQHKGLRKRHGIKTGRW